MKSKGQVVGLDEEKGKDLRSRKDGKDKQMKARKRTFFPRAIMHTISKR